MKTVEHFRDTEIGCHAIAHSSGTARAYMNDTRAGSNAQLALAEAAHGSTRIAQLAKLAAAIERSPRATSLRNAAAGAQEAGHARNRTGLPDRLKAGIESLSGIPMDNVRVHYHSSKPAQLNARAYAQGSEIHLATGEEKCLPHEAWHVVQQAQGRVKPILQAKGDMPINDDSQLEREADVMGEKAAGVFAHDTTDWPVASSRRPLADMVTAAGRQPLQRKITVKNEDLTSAQWEIPKKWDASSKEHNFSSFSKLGEAWGDAMEHHIPKNAEFNKAFFTEANLSFLTHTAGRLPTLYFNRDRESGRIRQQHRSGPLVSYGQYMRHYFFKDGKNFEDFYADKRAQRGQSKKSVDEAATSYNAVLDKPTSEDMHHVEFTFKAEKDESLLVASRHPSQGTTKNVDSSYSSAEIERIYAETIGLTSGNEASSSSSSTSAVDLNAKAKETASESKGQEQSAPTSSSSTVATADSQPLPVELSDDVVMQDTMDTKGKAAEAENK